MLLSQYGSFGALLLRRYNATKEAANSYLLEAERNAAASRSRETIKLLTVQYHGSVSLQHDFLLVCDIALQLVNDSEKSTPLFTTHIEAQKKLMVDRFSLFLEALRGKDASLEAECQLYSDRCNTLLVFADELRKGWQKRPCHQIGLLVGSLKGLLTDIALQTTNCDHLLTEESTKWLSDMLLVQSGLTDLITTASEANVLYDEYLRLHNLLEERLNDSHNCNNSELQLDNELCDVMSSSMLDVHESIFNRLKIVAELLASHALVSDGKDVLHKFSNISTQWLMEISSCLRNGNFRNLCGSEYLSDVILNVDGEKIPAHKVVLHAASPLFTAMFQSEANVAAGRNEVLIDDIEPAVLRLVVRFIYCGRIEPKDMTLWAWKLWMAADRFQLLMLKMVCEKHFVCNMTVNDCVKLLLSLSAAGGQRLLPVLCHSVKETAVPYFHRHSGMTLNACGCCFCFLSVVFFYSYRLLLLSINVLMCLFFLCVCRFPDAPLDVILNTPDWLELKLTNPTASCELLEFVVKEIRVEDHVKTGDRIDAPSVV
jgi:hypothetical protein